MSDRYEIREAIGQGGLGSVYKAFDTQLQREVAMKRVLSAGQGTEEEVRIAGDKLIAEAQTLSSLNHPNIVTVFDVGRDDKGGFVVMELLDGETLDETVERGVLTGEDFKEVVFQTMEGLIAAQAADVIHRDIKPTNIMLIWQASGRFQLKILDFGLAKFSKNPSVQTMDQDEAVMGSIFFMAPEQFERAELDARTDLYQMGCVYYNALTGQYPFNGETAPQVMNAHLQHKVVPLEQLRPDLPPALCQWVMWLINREISSRPANAKEALKFFPKDQSAAPALPVQAAVPVATPANAPKLKIATPTGKAKAPPKLVTGGPPKQSGPQVGKRPATQTSYQPLDVAEGKKGLSAGLLTALICGSLVVLLGLLVGVTKFNSSKRANRLVELSEQAAPVGSAKDVSLLVDFISDSGSSNNQRTAALQTLLKFEGDDTDPAILKSLKEASTNSVRKQLANVLSQRGYTPALPTLLRYSKIANGSEDKVIYLRAAEPLATVENFDSILENVSGATAAEMSIYQRMLASIIRSSSRTDKQLDAIQSKIASSKDDEEKRALYGVLGLVNGNETKRKLKELFAGNNLNEKELAFSAVNLWPTRDLLGVVESVIQSNDRVMKRPAQRSYNSIAIKPGAVTIDQRISDWKKGFDLMADNNQERGILMNFTRKYPHPKTVAMVNEWKKDPKLKSTAERVAGQLNASLKSIKPIKSGGKLKATEVDVTGSSGGVDRGSNAIVYWRSASTYFTWTFKPAESGDYSILVEQSDTNQITSEFVFYLNGVALTGRSKTTESYDDYLVVPVKGKVKLEANNYYHLILAAGESTQPRMMNVRSVILKK